MSWTESPAVVKSTRRIGTFAATVTMDESAVDEIEITKHPVQRGATIADHAFVKPATLTIKVAFDSAERPVEETYRLLREAQAAREPFEVVTGKRMYKDMLMQSIAVTTDKTTESVLSCTIKLEQVLLTDVVVTNVPPRARQKTPSKTAETQKSSAKQVQPGTTAAKKLFSAVTGK
jgi:hypothetical protein